MGKEKRWRTGVEVEGATLDDSIERKRGLHRTNYRK